MLGALLHVKRLMCVCGFIYHCRNVGVDVCEFLQLYIQRSHALWATCDHAFELKMRVLTTGSSACPALFPHLPLSRELMYTAEINESIIVPMQIRGLGTIQTGATVPPGN
jgi:hypothetical protein